MTDVAKTTHPVLYWKSTCDTCRAARSLVLALAPDTVSRDYAKAPLTEDEVREIVRLAGGTAPVINQRHEQAKGEGWATHPPDVDTYARRVVETPNLLRRPILIRDGSIVIGKQEAAIRALLA